jgi:phenylacetate-CoA ligase
MYPEISEAERFPRLTREGRRLLYALREHPQSPQWNWPNGEQLDDAGLERVREFAASLANTPFPKAEETPDWLNDFVTSCLEDVPFYRDRSAPGTPFTSIPSCSRADLAAAVWSFVPDSQPLDQLIVFSSSGTTGHPAKMPSHPVTAACGVPLIEHALAPHSVAVPRGTDHVAIASIVDYPGAYTTANVISHLDEAGYIRVNLQPDVWQTAGDRREFIDHWQGSIVIADPLALAALGRLGLGYQPRAIVSSIATLTDAFAADLQKQFDCPVLDLYALTEAGIVAVKTPHGHAVLPHDLYVEILDELDEPCPPGVRGEVTLSGGRNPFMPLLRYRTGDFASHSRQNGRLILHDLEGREPVLFQAADGGCIHSMQVSRALRKLPLNQFSLRQNGAGELTFTYRGSIDADAVRRKLFAIFGRDVPLTLSRLAAVPSKGKIIQYHSDIPFRGDRGVEPA